MSTCGIKLFEEMKNLTRRYFNIPDQPLNPPEPPTVHQDSILCKPVVVIKSTTGSISVTFLKPIEIDVEGLEIDSQRESDVILSEALESIEKTLSTRTHVALDDLEII